MPVSGVPLHLRDASYRGASQLGHGTGYSTHTTIRSWVKQHMPDELRGGEYYTPGSNPVEERVRQRLDGMKSRGRLIKSRIDCPTVVDGAELAVD